MFDVLLELLALMFELLLLMLLMFDVLLDLLVDHDAVDYCLGGIGRDYTWRRCHSEQRYIGYLHLQVAVHFRCTERWHKRCIFVDCRVDQILNLSGDLVFLLDAQINNVRCR